jgi:hypothetical protein
MASRGSSRNDVCAAAQSKMLNVGSGLVRGAQLIAGATNARRLSINACAHHQHFLVPTLAAPLLLRAFPQLASEARRP